MFVRRASRIRSYAVVVSVALGAGVAALAPPARAAPGDPDAGFGTAGVVSGLPGLAESVAEGPNGSLVTAFSTSGAVYGTIHLRRFTASGAPDPTFSGDGAIDLATASPTTGQQVLVDSAGRTILVSSFLGGTPYQVWRFEPDGDPDPTFSDDGTMTFPDLAVGFPGLSGLGIQPDGDLIVGINDSFPIGGISQLPQIVRITPAGVASPAVKVLPDHNESRRGGLAVTRVDGSGRVYVLVPDDGRLHVRRFTEAIALDTSYSGDGLATVTRPAERRTTRTGAPALRSPTPVWRRWQARSAPSPTRAVATRRSRSSVPPWPLA